MSDQPGCDCSICDEDYTMNQSDSLGQPADRGTKGLQVSVPVDESSLRDRRVIVTGSRNYTDTKKVFAALNWELEQTTGTLWVAHGGCPTGADAMAEQWVRISALAGLRVKRIEYKADWDRLGKSAGPIRNARMVSDGADVVLAFPLGASRGTRNTMKLAHTAGIPVKEAT